MRLAGMTIVSTAGDGGNGCVDWEDGGWFLVSIMPWIYIDNWNLARGVVAVASIVAMVFVSSSWFLHLELTI